jgi:RHS repeat-associated protein
MRRPSAISSAKAGHGHVYDGATGGGTQKWQSYSYDAFGNILAIAGTSGRSTPTSVATNRLNGTGTSYDAAGNLTAWNGNTYQYDGFNQMIRMKSGAEDWVYIYTAGDERFWSYRVGGGGSLWALRDLDGKILREYETHTSWGTFKDYIYRGSQLLASSHPTEGVRHLHLDHLGTPRLVTAGSTGGDFFTLTPCRVLDTRDQSAPLTAGETRTVTLAGVCGIPSTATAVSINITAVDATAQGEMTAWPANEPQPVSSANSYQASLNRANNGILKLGNGALAFFANQLSGTVHLVIDVNGYFTEPAGAVVAYHVYYPFGEEATAFNQDTEQMKFTGHERDLASLAGAGDDLDYMHARHCSPLTGRFLGTDRADILSLQIGKEEDQRKFRELLAQPQSWNRYSYSKNNPLKYVDLDGESPELAVGSVLVFSGGSGSAGITSLAAANPVGAVIFAGASGALLGTVINRIPGVSEAIQTGFGVLIDGVYLAQNTKHNVKVASGNIAQALAHIEKISAAGGPEKDPDFDHHQKEIKSFLENAKRAVNKLPGKLQDLYLRAIEEIAAKAGV